MLKLYDNVGSRDEVACDLSATALPEGVVWLDLLDATLAELRFVQQFVRVTLPDDASLGDLQTSTRLRFDGETIQVFAPVVYRDAERSLRTTTVGFVLNAKLLVTIRTEVLRSFNDYIARAVAPGDQKVHQPVDVFIGLLETIIDRLSDGMENVGKSLDRMSRHIFSGHLAAEAGRFKPVKSEKQLQDILRQVGRNGDLTSRIRDSLLGIGRMLAFVAANTPEGIPAGAKARIKTLRQDFISLNDYETRLTDKVQFLLDSTLGLISIEQNRSFKLLTIFSVLGIPPTFVVGLYGMNFKTMPEYDWAWGYAWGLFVTAMSIIIPAVWLRWKGWF